MIGAHTRSMDRILVVEDVPETQAVIAAALGQRLETRLASSARDARKLLEAGGIDLILLDVSLPDEDGFRLCSDWLADEKTKSIPIIFLSGRSEAGDKVHGLTLGAEDYITKPFDPSELRA